MADIAALIVAAGRGERAGGAVPKQFQQILGSPMLRLTVEALRRESRIGRVRVMIGAGQEPLYHESLAGLDVAAPLVGGATRQQSVRRGLEALEPEKPDFVLIHDAARPLVSAKVTRGVIDALLDGAAAAVPMIAVSDTLRRREDDGRWTLVPRERLHRAQTPQGFRFSEILGAHRRFASRDVTDDMALAELAGISVSAVAGDERNLKITTAEDFGLAEKLLVDMGDVRTGFGYDAHRFCPGDHVWLCGVKVAHDRGLEGHSDADAGLHALTDAILATVGEGDIGVHFPPSDPIWRGAPSWKFLDHAAGLVRAKGGRVAHCDVTLICERPKIGPHREAMRLRIAEILHIESARVSVKATTTEGMGFTGRGEGLAAHAVATIRLP